MNINYGSLIKRIEVNETMKYMQDELRKKHQELTQMGEYFWQKIEKERDRYLSDIKHLEAENARLKEKANAWDKLTTVLAKYGRYAKFFKDDCEYGIGDGYRLFVEYGAAGHVAINGFNDNPINAVWSAEKQCDEALNSQS